MSLYSQNPTLWRRRESNPRPKILKTTLLQAYLVYFMSSKPNQLTGRFKVKLKFFHSNL